MNAWVRREVKNSIRWLPIGLAPLAFLLWYQVHNLDIESCIRLSGSLFPIVWFASAAFAAFLGLVTYLPETFGPARGFLIQRGLSLQRIFAIRALVNFVVYLIAMLVPLGTVAIYLSVIGPHAAPVNPIQVVPSIFATFFSFSFYFGAVMVACRTCRWYGTRLLPLFASFLVSIAATQILMLFNRPIVSAAVFVLGALGMLLLVMSSRFVFVRQPNQPIPSRTQSSSYYEKATLVASASFATVAVAAFASSLSRDMYPPDRLFTRFTKQGVPWLIEERSVKNERGFQPVVEVKFPISESNEDEGPKPKENELVYGTAFSYPWFYSDNYWDMVNLGSFNLADRGPIKHYGADENTVCVLCFRGLLHVYRHGSFRQSRIVAVIGKEAVGDFSNTLVPFDGAPRFLSSASYLPIPAHGANVFNSGSIKGDLAGGSFAIATKECIYRIDLASAKIERLLDTKVQAYAFSPIEASAQQQNQLIISDGSSISVFEAEGLAFNGPLKIAEQKTTLDIPPKIAGKVANLLYQDPDNWTFISGISVHDRIEKYDVVRSIQKVRKQYTTSIPSSLTATNLDAMNRKALVPALLISPAVMATFGAISQWQGSLNPEFLWYGWIIAIQAMLSGVLASVAAGWRRISLGRIAVWFAAGAFIGLGAWILVLSLYPQVVLTKCLKCHRKRRIEEERCESCNAGWEPLAPIGIELFEREESITGVLETSPVLQN